MKRVIPRPSQRREYEEDRLKTNKELQKKICKLSPTLRSEVHTLVSFLAMNNIFNNRMFAMDGVHLNKVGIAAMGKKVLYWIKEKEKVPSTFGLA